MTLFRILMKQEMKPKVSNPFDEQETIINIDPAQISDRCTVYTTIPTDLKRMWKLHEQNPDDVLIVHDDKWGSEFSIPRKWVVIRKPRQVSEEQRLAAAERFAKYRAEHADEEVTEEEFMDGEEQ